MTLKPIALTVAFAVVASGGYALYRLGLDRGMASVAPASAQGAVATAAAGTTDDPAAKGRKVLYWHDPMVPAQKFDKPGKSPFMDMELVPVYADAGGDAGGVSIDPRVQQNLGMRTAEVRAGVLANAVEAVGSVAYNERDVAVVQARSNGFLERLYVRAPLDPVQKGQPLAEIYVPDWVAAQEEYLSARRIGAQTGMVGLDDAAAQRMRLAGMNEQQVRAVEAAGNVQARFTLVAPISGVVGEITAREGMTLAPGAPLFRINGLSSVWVNAEIPEALAAQVRPGTPVQARTPALAGTIFKGRVGAVLPAVNMATRTLTARIELANPGGQLVPGMFARISVAPMDAGQVLLVPTEAVIQTGTRSVVIVAQADGMLAPVEVEVGRDSRGQTEIRKGLAAGQRVVVSGQFLVDSEANLRASTARMAPQPASAPASQPSDTEHAAAPLPQARP